LTIVLIIDRFSTFAKIVQNSAEISKFRGKGQILQVGSKFRVSQKTV